MENYIHFITNIAVDAERPLRPVYGIVPTEPLEEWHAPELAGFQGMGPVRVGNQAAEQMQHDAYGSVILGASQMFIDERLPRMGDAALFHRLEPLGMQARRFAFEPDAGPWEYRGRQRIHTHSATMCWVACDRLASIALRLGLASRAAHWREQADALRNEILARAWNERRGAIAGALDHDELDASVLLLHELGILPPSDERFRRTCDVIGKELNRNGFIMRYTSEDDFGLPETAFLVCQFWYIDALAATGRVEEARQHVCRHPRAQKPVRPAVRGHPSGHGPAVGQPAANLFDGRHRQYGPHPVAQLAGGLGRSLRRHCTPQPDNLAPRLRVRADRISIRPNSCSKVLASGCNLKL